jgi:hypothetical protein
LLGAQIVEGNNTEEKRGWEEEELICTGLRLWGRYSHIISILLALLCSGETIAQRG